MQIVPTDHTFDIPPEVAICPYCDARLTAHCEAWTETDEESIWEAEQVSVDCDTQPDLDSDEWDEWADIHTDMPYVYWLPVSTKVEQWIDKNFRFQGR